MAGIIVKSFFTPDESRTPEKTKVDVVKLGGVTALRITLQPGWVWSECVGPVAGTDTCQANHVGCVESGKAVIKMDDVIKPGHDACVVGDESFVAYEFDTSTAETYAK
jgi:hypothetical protein